VRGGGLLGRGREVLMMRIERWVGPFFGFFLREVVLSFFCFALLCRDLRRGALYRPPNQG
jgi:hypothetical protein